MKDELRRRARDFGGDTPPLQRSEGRARDEGGDEAAFAKATASQGRKGRGTDLTRSLPLARCDQSVTCD